jgi:hypothetical protein
LRFTLTPAARVSAFEFVIGEELDVVPPGLAVEMGGRLRNGRQC